STPKAGGGSKAKGHGEEGVPSRQGAAPPPGAEAAKAGSDRGKTQEKGGAKAGDQGRTATAAEKAAAEAATEIRCRQDRGAARQTRPTAPCGARHGPQYRRVIGCACRHGSSAVAIRNRRFARTPDGALESAGRRARSKRADCQRHDQTPPRWPPCGAAVCSR